MRREADFQIFTGLLKAAKGPDDRMRLHGVASSNTRDLHGDIMTLTALQDMERAANKNLTIFLNHSYNVPEDVAGSVELAKLTARESDMNGQIYDLDFDIVIDESNPRAVQTWNSIQKGTKLGISVGAMIPDGGAKREKAGSFQFEHVDLLEGSFVGIPAQPRSWVDSAVKSLSGIGKNEWFETMSTGTASTGTIYTWFDPTATFAGMCPSCGGSKGSPKGDCTSDYHTKAVTPDVTDASKKPNPFADKGDDNNDNGDNEDDSKDPKKKPPKKDLEPDITDAKVKISIETDEPVPTPQGAQSSGPGAGVGLRDETADGDDAVLGDAVTRGFAQVTDLLRTTTRELIVTRQALTDALTAKTNAETNLTLALSERDRVLTETRRLIDRIADTPLVRRATVRDAEEDFSRFSNIYDPDFLKMLTEKNHA